MDWHGAPFASLKALPTDARAITTWSNQDAAFTDVAVGIRRAIEDLSSLQSAASRATLPPVKLASNRWAKSWCATFSTNAIQHFIIARALLKGYVKVGAWD